MSGANLVREPGNRLVRVRVLVVGCLTFGGPVAASEVSLGEVQSLDQCDALVRDHPRSLEAHRCYWMVARRNRAHSEALERLRRQLSWRPDNHRIHLYMGAIEGDLGSPRAEGLYREAAAGLHEEGEFRGEVYARLSLEWILRQDGRLDEARDELERAARAAEASGERELAGRVLSARGWQSYQSGDYAGALRRFRELESTVFPDGPSDLQSTCLSGLGAASWGLTRYRQAVDYYRRQASLLREAGDRFAESTARVSLLLLTDNAGILRDDERERIARETLEAAQSAGNLAAQASAHRLLSVYLSGEESRDHAREALRLGRATGDHQTLVYALCALARTFRRDDPDRARALVAEATETARRTGNAHGLVAARIELARLGWGEDGTADASTRRALGAIEDLRDLQSDDLARATLVSRWARFYHDYAAHLLRPFDRAPPAERLEQAHAVIERLRSRQLLEKLDLARALPAPRAPAELLERRDAALARIADLQRRLLDPALPEDARDGVLDELDRLELDEKALRLEIARADPAFAELRMPDVLPLAELRRRLDADQAIFVYQIPAHPDGEAWLAVHTRDGSRVYGLSAGAELGERIELFVGLLRGSDGSEAAAARLFDDLFARPLADLPRGVRRLTVVPDGPLHTLPFEVLRPGPDSPRLLSRFEFVRAPSVTVWVRLRGSASPTAPSSALVLADPAPLLGDSPPAAVRLWTRDGGIDLGPLPFARDEGQAVVARLGSSTTVRTGDEATERFFKQAALADHGILHLAAHAVVDHLHPERSAILLAPGADTEDGLLQFREIVDLDLQGNVVLLSTCHSAAGSIYTHEGVMGLAHAFFQAGARTVVGSLWRLGDEDAALLFDRFYRHLGRGRSVAAALAAARRDRMRDGAPEAAWAGVVVLGDGDVVPLPGGAPRSVLRGIGWGALLLLLATLVWIALRRR